VIENDFNWQLPTFIIGVIALALTVWVLCEARKARIIGRQQLQLSTEPDFEFRVTMPNKDPIQVNCRNRGIAIDDFEVFADGTRLNVSVESGNIREDYSYNIDIPESLTQDKVTLLLKVAYRDKLKKRRERFFLYDVKSRMIKPSP
jgi:hypothetical protein